MISFANIYEREEGGLTPGGMKHLDNSWGGLHSRGEKQGKRRGGMLVKFTTPRHRSPEFLQVACKAVRVATLKKKKKKKNTMP